MDKEALKKSVSLNLRCVTQSCKGGVPLNRLEKDYKDLIGKPIPINDLGFNSITLFLQSIPDVVCLKRINDGQIIVEGVADASTAHIANLISKQKSSKTGKGPSKKPSLHIRKYSCHESWKSSATNSAKIHKQENKASVTHPVKLKMPELKTSNTELADSGLKKVATNTMPSKELPVLLNSSQKLTGLQQGTSQPSNSMLTDKEITKVSNGALLPKQSSNIAIGSTLSTRQLARQRVKMRKAAQELISTSKLSLTESQVQTKVLEAQKLCMTTEQFLEWLKESSSTLKENQNPAKCTEQKSKEKQKLKSLLRKIWNVAFRIGRVQLSRLAENYATLYGTPIPYKELGYTRLRAFIEDIPDVIRLEKSIEGQYFAEAVKRGISQASSLAAQQKKVPSTSNDSINHASQSGWETSSNSSSNTYTIRPAPDLKTAIGRSLKNFQSVLSSRNTIASTPPPQVIKTIPVSGLQGASSNSKNSSTLGETTINSSPLIVNQDPAKCTEQLSKEKQKLKSLALRNLWNVAFRFEGGIQLCQLPKEYMTLYGTPIPFKELGYTKLKAFIQDIPDVIRLTEKEGGKYEVAEAVRDIILPTSSLASQQKEVPSTANESINNVFQSGWETSSNSSNTSKIIPAPDLKASIENSLKSVQSVLSSYNTITSIPQPPVVKTIPVLPSFCQGATSESVSSNELNLSNLGYKPTLNSFPSIKHSIESSQFNSLLLMNILLYGDDSFMGILKRGILAFDGFPFSKDSDEWKQKQLLLSMLPEDTLKECLKMLCIECDSNNKQVLLYKLMQFLFSPSKALSERNK